MQKIFQRLNESERIKNRAKYKVESILDKEDEYRNKTDEELKKEFSEIRSYGLELLGKNVPFKEEQAFLEEHLVQVFSIIRESAFRVLGMRAYPVQLMGAIILHEGEVAEMATGEGKTLVGVFPAILNSLIGKGVFVISVNDYLTKRDLGSNQPLFDYLGLTSGYVIEATTTEKRQNVYQRDIIYVENTQLGFDYLKDNRILKPEEQLIRELYYCIADEVDSVMLDEARTPMVLTVLEDEVPQYYVQANTIVANLTSADYVVYEDYHSVVLSDKGIDKVQNMLEIDDLFTAENQEFNHYLFNALVANYYLKEDVHYVVKDDRVLLLDEHTGRVNESHRMNDGLHQSLEAKEGVPIKKEAVTLNSVTYQQFFRQFKKICGMSGTAITEAREFMDVYNLVVVVIPTNKPLARVDQGDVVYSTQENKYRAVAKKTKENVNIGRPVLIGVNSIVQAEALSKMFEVEGISHRKLTAKNVEREAEIISMAGQLGSVTIATNMAGRGTDIKLGPGVSELGGLLIIGTEKNINRRVDLQLRGRAGRQGDVGESIFYLSLEDDLIMVHGSKAMRYALENVSEAARSQNRGDGFVTNPVLLTYLNRSQLILEGSMFDSRKKTIEYDGVIESQRNLFFDQRKEMLFDINVISKIIYSSGLEDRIASIKKFEGMRDEDKKEIHQQSLRIVDQQYIIYLKRLEDIRYEVLLMGYAGQSPVKAYHFKTHELFSSVSKSIQEGICQLVLSYKEKSNESD